MLGKTDIIETPRGLMFSENSQLRYDGENKETVKLVLLLFTNVEHI